MYCNFCGCKLDSMTTKCPSCGQNAKAEFCGGFWGLVGEENKQEVSSVAKEPEIKKNKNASELKNTDFSTMDIKPVGSQHTKKIRQKKKRNQMKRKIIVGMLGVLFVICVIQTIRLSEEYKKYNNIQDKYAAVQKDLTDIQKQNKQLLKDQAEIEEKQNRLRIYNRFLEAQNFVLKQKKSEAGDEYQNQQKSENTQELNEGEEQQNEEQQIEEQSNDHDETTYEEQSDSQYGIQDNNWDYGEDVSEAGII